MSEKSWTYAFIAASMVLGALSLLQSREVWLLKAKVEYQKQALLCFGFEEDEEGQTIIRIMRDGELIQTQVMSREDFTEAYIEGRGLQYLTQKWEAARAKKEESTP